MIIKYLRSYSVISIIVFYLLYVYLHHKSKPYKFSSNIGTKMHNVSKALPFHDDKNVWITSQSVVLSCKILRYCMIFSDHKKIVNVAKFLFFCGSRINIIEVIRAIVFLFLINLTRKHEFFSMFDWKFNKTIIIYSWLMRNLMYILCTPTCTSMHWKIFRIANKLALYEEVLVELVRLWKQRLLFCHRRK